MPSTSRNFSWKWRTSKSGYLCWYNACTRSAVSIGTRCLDRTTNVLTTGQSDCARRRATIYFVETTGGSNERHISTGVGRATGAVMRVARAGASFLFRGVRRSEDRYPAGSGLESRLDQSAHLHLCGREGRRRKDDHMGVAITASAVFPRER